jgi:site-specific recombinase XerC
MSPLTQKAYVRAVKNFSLHFRRSPDLLTFEDVRAYQLHLVSRGLEATTINQVMCALRFLYGTTLGKKDASEEIKLARQSDPLPVVLSRDEVARFLKAVPDLRWRTALVTIYAAGLRVSEANFARLRINEARGCSNPLTFMPTVAVKRRAPAPIPEHGTHRHRKRHYSRHIALVYHAASQRMRSAESRGDQRGTV